MKKLLFVLILFLASCSNSSTIPTNPEKVTTLEVVNSAEEGCYTFSEIDDTIYILNENKLVVRVIHNQTGSSRTTALILVLVILMLAIFSVITD